MPHYKKYAYNNLDDHWQLQRLLVMIHTKLADINDTGATVLNLGVTASVADIGTKVQQAWDVYLGGIDVLVNNATGRRGSFNHNQLLRPVEHHLSNTPKLRAQRTGTLLYINSQLAWYAEPSAGGYCSAKPVLKGVVEYLSKKPASFAPGLKALLVEPSYFDTKGASQIVGSEPGNADKAVKVMIDVLKGNG
ncbi:hypothetical protein QQS21_004786 [Conoideocrella luteorostrata]|uniref:Uncharacterized protein n=1 Tax=Conoideocrella luteorostrata TaxID=1105319 RepID=A0AAJ0FZJ7_9HYPO|nr:hypothetical protein QQS21_004786 [Conoideocrella luteorostrata]